MTHNGPVGSTLLATACLLMAAGVALGAFGAHALRTRLAPDLLVIYETGVRYHLIHGVAAVLSVLLARGTGAGGRRAEAAGWSFVLGIVFFSGSLYLLALTGQRWLGAVTPLGGVAWIVGWLLLALSALPRR
jgi:uncharacterized membrane protein YgdD (TMEM256/DUF423 family)